MFDARLIGNVSAHALGIEPFRMMGVPLPDLDSIGARRLLQLVLIPQADSATCELVLRAMHSKTIPMTMFLSQTSTPAPSARAWDLLPPSLQTFATEPGMEASSDQSFANMLDSDSDYEWRDVLQVGLGIVPIAAFIMTPDADERYEFTFDVSQDPLAPEILKVCHAQRV